MSFICRQCGKCCHDLLTRDHGILRGITLLPEETKHYPEGLINPYLGEGKRPNDPKFKVIAYQLTTETCPNLKEDKCSIYVNRPITCRQFPFSLDPDGESEMLLGVDMNCQAAVKLVKKLDGLIEFPYRESATKLYELKKQIVDNPRKFWIYDLDKEIWVRSDKLV
jgi:Fe-S-cluster containining protein